MARVNRGGSAVSDQCYFCDESEALDRHHVVPRRHGGSDDEENLVTVCPNCHRKLETLYDSRFYNEVGVKSDVDDLPCWWETPVGIKTVGGWAEFLIKNERAIRRVKSGDLDFGGFWKIGRVKTNATDSELEAAWQFLLSDGVIYDERAGVDDNSPNYSTQKHYIELLEGCGRTKTTHEQRIISSYVETHDDSVFDAIGAFAQKRENEFGDRRGGVE